MLYSVQVTINLLTLFVTLTSATSDPPTVIYAVNAGGGAHVDKYGTEYEADPLQNIGTASDYGNTLESIERVTFAADDVLYRTERYHTASFGYDVPLDGDGYYVLVLKFCEVYFNKPAEKVFDVQLNRRHVVVADLDIFDRVGRGTALEEFVYFKVQDGRLHYKQEASDIYDNKVYLEFIKGPHDNPKINAFVLFKGDVSKIPKLPPLARKSQKLDTDMAVFNDRVSAESREILGELNEHGESERPPDQSDFFGMENIFENEAHLQEDQGAGTVDLPTLEPYDADHTYVLLPVCVLLGAVVPLMYCFCKL